MRRFHPETALLLFGAALVGILLLGHLSYPLMWQDEGETAMFAERVLRYGYPKVHGDRNVLYEFGTNIAVGVDEPTDAYIGTTWGHFYFAVPGALAARDVDDPYAKTLRLRLPFALAGAAGIALWIAAIAPVFRGEERRGQLFAGAFLVLTAGSTSFLLHLREVRYYGLLTLLTAAVAAIQLRRRLSAGCRGRGWTAVQAVLLALVFHTFFAAWFYLVALLAVDGLWSAVRSGGDAGSRARRALAELAPSLLSALLVAPALVFFETFQIATRFSADVGLSAAGTLENLGFFVRHFASFELLIPAAVCRAAVAGVGALAAQRGVALPDERGRVVASRLAWFVVGYAALACLNPLVYERYFVILVPAVTAVFLLDAFALVDSARRLARPGRAGRAAAACVVALLGLLAATGGARATALRGRWTELSVPVRGPLDFVVEHIRNTEPHPEELVIATNYENHPLMYYLGSHVIVGTNLNNIVRERLLAPDVVIPRRRWPRGLTELRGFLRRSPYARHTLPVRDLHFNATPALSRSRWQPDTHRYETAAPGQEGGLVVYRKSLETP